MSWDDLQLHAQVLELFAEETYLHERRCPPGFSVIDHAKKLQNARELRAALPAAERRRRRREEYQRLKSTPEGREQLKRWRAACYAKRTATPEGREKMRAARRRSAKARRAGPEQS